MQVHRDIKNLPFFHKAVITIGTFDGVHTGHHQIILQMKAESEKINGETVIITFDPHPRMVISPASSPGIRLLNTLDEKILLLENQQVDHLVIINFTKEFADQPAEDYIKNFLVAHFHPEVVIIGYDHRFGKNRSGDYKLLEQFQASCGYEVKEIPEHVLDNAVISSTRIRKALLSGNIEIANEALGYEYFFQGIIVEGNKLGKKLGYPTANIQVEEESKLIPSDGIYAVEAELVEENNNEELYSDNKKIKGMMSIGIRPTIGYSDRTIEVNLFDFDKNIYGRTLRVFLKSYIRPEVKFEGLEELKKQIDLDKIAAENILNIH
ncbi:bifunctional riboflavin kinase/FAD synthetase [soil metagenome]